MTRRQRDYGLGLYRGQPLVQLTGHGECYHRAGHHDGGTTFTESFARECGWQPCAVCFPFRSRRRESTP